MLRFEDMSNDLILYVWEQLTSADVIFSFLHLNIRLNSLLREFRDLYQQLDLRFCSLPASRFFCRQVPTIPEWQHDLTVLKLGNRYRCSQLDFFADEVIKSVVVNHFAKQGKSCDSPSKDIFRVLMTYSKHIQPIFPQLISLVTYQSVSINEDCRDTLLYVVAGGSTMRRFTWNAGHNQTHHSRAFFDWLFRCSLNLLDYQLIIPSCENGFELTYEHTIIHGYVPHHSLINLKINILNLSTLYVLLHYLPQLEHLDVCIDKVIDPMNDIDRNLRTILNHPTKLRTLNLRLFKIAGRNCQCLAQLLNQFADTLEEFSLFLIHYCHGKVNDCFNGYHLAALCSRLSRLRSIHFAIRAQINQLLFIHTLDQFIETFRIPYWLNGPLGRIRVCVDFHQIFGFVQMFSLPYVFSNTTLSHSIDLINMLFNTDEGENQISNDLSMALEPLWFGMKWLFISMMEKQKIPIAFLRALQCPSISQGKVLIITQERGILPDDIADHYQLKQFTTLQLNGSISINTQYDFKQLIAWFRLLPNIKCLYVNSTELKYWFNYHNQYFDTFLRHIDRLYIDCSSIININSNEEIRIPLLSFIIDKHRFPQLYSLRFIECKHISSAWCNLSKWIDFILIHINEHQLKCLRFDFIEKEHDELTDLQTTDEIIANTESPSIVDIHRFVTDNHISLWMERRQK